MPGINKEKIFELAKKVRQAWIDCQNKKIAFNEYENAERELMDAIIKDAGRKYDDLSIEEKADFISGLLDGGIFEYLDRCSKNESGNYDYYSSEEDKTYTYTSEELVNNLETGIGKNTIEEYWEEEN